MAYEKKNFENGQVLNAEDLNKMESGIAGNADSINRRIDDIAAKVRQARFSGGRSSVKPISILHMSDIHADKRAYSCIVEDAARYGDLVDCVVCTGDMMSDSSAESFAWWNPKVMAVVGNHDAAVWDGTRYHWTAFTMRQRYERYIAPFKDVWGVQVEAGKSYYYKDFSENKTRLIALDIMLYNGDPASDEASAQTAWLSGLLDGAIAEQMHVVILVHAPHGSAVPVKCGFTKLNAVDMPVNSDCNTPDIVVNTVAGKIAGGLKFAGYLCGHTHQDGVWDALGDGTQYMYAVSCGITNYRGSWGGTDTEHELTDVYNIVTIDTANSMIKIVRCGQVAVDNVMRSRDVLCVRYSDGTIVNEASGDHSGTKAWKRIIKETVSEPNVAQIKHDLSGYAIGDGQQYSEMMDVVDIPAIASGGNKTWVSSGFGWEDSTQAVYGYAAQSYSSMDMSRKNLMMFHHTWVGEHMTSEFRNFGYGEIGYPLSVWGSTCNHNHPVSSAQCFITTLHRAMGDRAAYGDPYFPVGTVHEVWLR